MFASKLSQNSKELHSGLAKMVSKYGTVTRVRSADVQHSLYKFYPNKLSSLTKVSSSALSKSSTPGQYLSVHRSIEIDLRVKFAYESTKDDD